MLNYRPTLEVTFPYLLKLGQVREGDTAPDFRASSCGRTFLPTFHPRANLGQSSIWPAH